ncbi:SDR family oxidoreductase [Dyella amyloliquefaciens]|uniref:SDR family oxidoreductase n=1 Tax=Dyella amyloliquefaciens TaxID=1770545 RepID=UPI00102EB171|nr:SDR family oxidoreductase [Dyella amyloliquefaciens]
MRIGGCRALVTGAGRGLGAAFVQSLRRAGADTIYVGMREPRELNQPGLIPVALDVSDPDSIAAAATRCSDVSLLINNAGVMKPDACLLDVQGSNDLHEQLAVNLFGMLDVTRAFAPSLADAGGGCVVNMLSALSWASLPHTSTYSVSKAAAWSLTNGLRNELRAQRTQVIAVHVGYVDTDMARAVNAPKLAPDVVATRVLEAIERGDEEILVDDTARQVKAAMLWPRPLYLGPDPGR